MKTKHLSAVVGEPLAVAVIQPVGQPRRLGREQLPLFARQARRSEGGGV
jgi:hypothetical protein